MSFDGALFGSSAVYFPVTRNLPFTGTTLSAPARVHLMLLTGLYAQRATYAVSVQHARKGNLRLPSTLAAA